MANVPLRGCPTCKTPVAEAALGLRDYRWCSQALPGKVAPMDFDFVLERGGHFLIIEFKPRGAVIPTGQARTLRAARTWADVWVVKGGDDWTPETPTMVEVDFGDGFVSLEVYELASEVQLWFEEASR